MATASSSTDPPSIDHTKSLSLNLSLTHPTYSFFIICFIQLSPAKIFTHNDTFGKMIIFSIFLAIAQALEAYDYGKFWFNFFSLNKSRN